MTQFEDKLNDKTVRVGVIGLGYVGLPLVHVFWQAGLRTVGFDIDPGKIDKLAKGETYIKHFAAENVRAMNTSGRFSATSDFAELADVARLFDGTLSIHSGSGKQPEVLQSIGAATNGRVNYKISGELQLQLFDVLSEQPRSSPERRLYE